MVQVHIPKQLMGALFLGSLEMMAFEDHACHGGFVGEVFLLVPSTYRLCIAREQVVSVLRTPAHNREGLHPLALLSGEVSQPPVLLNDGLTAAPHGLHRFAPFLLAHGLRQLVQFAGPLVVSHAPAPPAFIEFVEIFTRTQATVGVKMCLARPSVFLPQESGCAGRQEGNAQLTSSPNCLRKK